MGTKHKQTCFLRWDIKVFALVWETYSNRWMNSDPMVIGQLINAYYLLSPWRRRTSCSQDRRKVIVLLFPWVKFYFTLLIDGLIQLSSNRSRKIYEIFYFFEGAIFEDGRPMLGSKRRVGVWRWGKMGFRHWEASHVSYEGIGCVELERNVLREFGVDEARFGVALSYWPPTSMELATGIRTPPVLITSDGTVKYFCKHLKVKGGGWDEPVCSVWRETQDCGH